MSMQLQMMSKSPVSVLSSPSSSDLEQFDALSQRARALPNNSLNNNHADSDPFDLTGLGQFEHLYLSLALDLKMNWPQY